MVSWMAVGIIYILDVLIFGYLFFYFMNTSKYAQGQGKMIMQTMTILTGVLFVQEIYFGINTLTDPNKLAIGSAIFPFVNVIWIYAKIILTIAGVAIIYMLANIKNSSMSTKKSV